MAEAMEGAPEFGAGGGAHAACSELEYNWRLNKLATK